MSATTSINAGTSSSGRTDAYDALRDALVAAYARDCFEPSLIRLSPHVRNRLGVEAMLFRCYETQALLDIPVVVAITHPVTGREVALEDAPALPSAVAVLWRSETDNRLVTLKIMRASDRSL